MLRWAEERLQQRYPGKPAGDREAIAEPFVLAFWRVNFGYLAGVEPARREAYLATSLERRAGKFFQHADERRRGRPSARRSP